MDLIKFNAYLKKDAHHSSDEIRQRLMNEFKADKSTLAVIGHDEDTITVELRGVEPKEDSIVYLQATLNSFNIFNSVKVGKLSQNDTIIVNLIQYDGI